MPKRKSEIKITKVPCKPIADICCALGCLGIAHVTEYKFLSARKFRFDIAILTHKIAIEYEGGIFTSGRHTRGAGYAKDTEKYNLATLNGWRVLRYTVIDYKRDNFGFYVADQVQSLIANHPTNK